MKYKLSEINNRNNRAELKKSLRLWPGVLLSVVLVLVRYLLPVLFPRATAAGIFGGMVLSLGIFIWWLFLSRSLKAERWGSFLLIILSLTITWFLLDKSIATANMGFMFIMYSIPILSVVFVLWALLTRNMRDGTRRISMILTIIISAGFWIFLRTDGMTGDARHNLNWRWAKTNEEKLIRQTEGESMAGVPDSYQTDIEAEWPGFRGKDRDGIVHGLNINTDWSKNPPVELWRRPVGPGCSSVAVSGNLIYTHEQLGDYETVSCYDLSNGKPVWRHKDKARFYDSHAGAGPRATPVIERGRVYTMGATGILNALNASNGNLIWTRNTATDTSIEIPEWGICGSPLVTGNTVIVSLAGTMAAYDTETGDLIWTGGKGGSGYSSPHLMTICNVPQVLIINEPGVESIDASTGKTLWTYPWKLRDRVLQPAWTGNNELLINEEYKTVRKIKVTNDASGWSISEIWTSPEIKMLYNDFVIHNGYAYGFDGPTMACIDLTNGKRLWRGSRYRGFQLLLADQDLILVLSEKGELALVNADPERFTELSKIQVLKGKTWNHPAIKENILIVRNSEEMAAFRL